MQYSHWTESTHHGIYITWTMDMVFILHGIMVFISDGHDAHILGNHTFRFVEGIWSHQKSRHI